jgi:hypothetical protein
LSPERCADVALFFVHSTRAWLSCLAVFTSVGMITHSSIGSLRISRGHSDEVTAKLMSPPRHVNVAQVRHAAVWAFSFALTSSATGTERRLGAVWGSRSRAVKSDDQVQRVESSHFRV